MLNLYLIAHVVNAISETHATIELEVASPSADGEWYTNDGRRVVPYWTQSIEYEIPHYPEGWLNHLSKLAHRFAAKQPNQKINILSLIPQAMKQPTIRRRL